MVPNVETIDSMDRVKPVRILLVAAGVATVLLSIVVFIDQFQRSHERRIWGEQNEREGREFRETHGNATDVVTLPSGLQYRIIQHGTGPTIGSSNRVKIHYRGVLIDGTEFDSSYDRGPPQVFFVEELIVGYREALRLMPTGAKWQLVVPPKLGYGDKGLPPMIGPQATLIFDIELLGTE